MVEFKLTYDSLKLSDLDVYMSDPEAGGHVVFAGTVRNSSKGKDVVRLEFEAYEPMAISELQTICEQMLNRWELRSIVLLHRLGNVAVGEIPVLALVSSAHRKEAFEACEFLMNQLKKSVPIWKKEVYADGHFWVSSTP